MNSNATRGESLFQVWLRLRLYTMLCAVAATTIFARSDLERSVAAWPPSWPLTTWLNRLLIAPWNRWDAEYYIAIASEGYRADNKTPTFHPLLAWLAKPLAWLTGNPLLCLLLVSSIATLLLYLAFERLARFDQEPETARTSTLLLVFWPTSFILYAPYTESLVMLLSVSCLLLARQRRWWLAGLAGGLAALAKQQGLFIALPLAWELWEAAERDARRALRAWRAWLALALVPCGYLVWVVYRALALNDVRPDFSSFNALVYTTVLSPSSNQVVWDQGFMWPWQAAWRALVVAWQLQRLDPWLALFFGLVFLCAGGAAWRGMRTSYRLYVLTIFLVTFSYHTGMNNTSGAYISLPRHLELAFPIFIGLGARCGPRALFALKWLGLVGFTFFLFGYFSMYVLP